MFRDTVSIRVHAGDGGRGCVAFRREKYVPRGGPSGGDGGRGGDVVLVCDPNSSHLGHLRQSQLVVAKRGQHGRGGRCHGASGKEVGIKVAPGTVVHDQLSGELLGDLAVPDQRLRVATGGRGGRGNARFATSTRQAPRFAEEGGRGEKFTLQLELKLIADIGLIGRPNAGKTTLLRALTGSKGKVGDYPFTTLEPNLGVVDLGDYERVVVADVPGLIAGAHRGEGLGLNFLRHIDRTRALAVVVDAACPKEDTEPWGHYLEVCRELRHYRPELLLRPRALIANKLDLEPASQRLRCLREAAAAEDVAYCEVSAISGVGLDSIVAWIRQLGQPAQQQVDGPSDDGSGLMGHPTTATG